MKELICFLCPNGCLLSVENKQSEMIVSGQKCKRGKEFAIAEETNPMRTLSSTVRTMIPGIKVIPVKSARAIPKNRIFDVMAEINRVAVTQVLCCGAPVITNVLGLGVDIIATATIEINE